MKIKIVLFLHCLVFIQWSCDPQVIDEPDPNPNPQNEKLITYLALGDSYTIGESVAVNERYPVQLVDSLFPDSDVEEREVAVVAQTGWTTDELQFAINSVADDLRDTFDLVSLLIGVNNQFRGYPIDDYKTEFRALLNQAIGYAANDVSRVFVVSIPDYAYTPFGNGNPNISQGIDDYNEINKEISDELGVQYFNITPISREGLNDTELVASDGLHPSAKQYAEWVKLMLPTVRLMID